MAEVAREEEIEGAKAETVARMAAGEMGWAREAEVMGEVEAAEKMGGRMVAVEGVARVEDLAEAAEEMSPVED